MFKSNTFIPVILLAAVLGAGAAEPTVSGKITKVDADAKTFTVKAGDNEQVIRYNDKSVFEVITLVEANDVPDGSPVKVTGKFSDGTAVITASTVEKLPDSYRTYKVIDEKQNYCVGILRIKDDGLTVLVGEKTITIKSSEKMKYTRRTVGGATDLETGRSVWGVLVPAEAGQEPVLKRLIITKY